MKSLRALLRTLQPLPRRLVIGLALALTMLLGLGLLSYHNIERQVEATNWVEHTYKVVDTLRNVIFSVQEVDNTQRLFVVSGSDRYLQNFDTSVRKLSGLLAQVDQMIIDNPAQVQRLKKTRADIDQRLIFGRTRIAQRQELGADALGPKFISSAAATLMETIQSDISAMVNAENHLLDERLQVLQHTRARGLFFQTAIGGFSILLIVVVFAGLVRNFLRLERAEMETQRSNALLKDANNELRAFSYSVAHDLRAPLRAISGFAQVVSEDCADSLNPEGRQALTRITSNANMMGQLIDDLLSLSKVSYQPLRTGRVEMTELVRAACEELKLEQTGREVQFEIEELPPASGDSSLLRQVWINLIGNALKFTRNRDKARIEIGGNVAGPEFATYFIRDNGAGFDMKYVNKLFGAFQRLHRPAEFEGTGIGLALVQRIVHRHGGAIWAEGKENEGARFAFTLPEWNEQG